MKLAKPKSYIVATIVTAFLAISVAFLLKGNPVVAGCESTEYLGQAKVHKLALYDGEVIEGVPIDSNLAASHVLGVSNNTDRWIEIDLSEQRLYAWEGDKLFLSTLVSTGLPFTKTPVGEYNIWIKLRSTKMEGGVGSNYYYLPNVPFVMFLENDDVPAWKGYGLHGTYWHNDFGVPKSHGCVNLPTEVAEKLYSWTGPQVGSGRWVAYASAENPGTKVVIHE